MKTYEKIIYFYFLAQSNEVLIMKLEKKKIFPSLTGIIGILGIYLISGHPLCIFAITVGLSNILIHIFLANDYNNKIFYMLFLGIIAFQGLILAYIYLFRTIYIQFPMFYLLFGLAIGIFIFHILYFVYYYPHKHGDPKIPIN